MTEIPAYLLGRSRRLHQAEHNTELTLANENSGGGSTEDGDFKQLRKVREVNNYSHLCKPMSIHKTN